MPLFQSIVLAVVQGITEFLTISSSAHLVLIPRFFHWKHPGLAFDVFLHLGTLVATLIYFAADWLRIVRAGIQSMVERRVGFDTDRQLFWWIGFACVPGVVLGVFFHHSAETFFREPILIAIPMSLVGFLMYWVDMHFPSLRSIQEISFKDAIWIGFAQACALVPGVSRSGSTITMGRYCGLTRPAAARFSFLLSLPITFGAFLFEWRKLADTTAMDPSLTKEVLWGGFIASGLLGMLAIHFLLFFLRTASLKTFAWYRVLLSMGILAWAVFGRG